MVVLVPTLSHPPSLHLIHYQLYAVQNWIVQRSPLPLLVVYTGNPLHSISLSPLLDHSHIPLLRHNGARPMHTPHGSLFTTSLAHFPSDYTIVLIPNGDFPSAKFKLYTNINLLRFGCSGRSALTLEDPSDTTKLRFSALYLHNNPDTATVLEFVKIIQAALSIFGFFNRTPDGLLCDESVLAIRKWSAHFGEPSFGLQPIDRLLDPALLAAILSLVLSTRNKLASLGVQNVPRDPFLNPHLFSLALASYSSSHYLTPNTILSINSAYQSRSRQDSRLVRRALKGKLDDFTSAVAGTPPHSDNILQTTTPPGDPNSSQILSGIASGLRRSTHSTTGPAGIIDCTTDLAAFVAAILKDGTHSRHHHHRKPKDRRSESVDLGRVALAYGREREKVPAVAASLTALWSGRLADLESMRNTLSDPSRDHFSDPDEKAKSDGRLTEEDIDQDPYTIGGLLGKTLESLTGRTRRKSTSVDLAMKPKTRLITPLLSHSTLHSDQDEDDILSSGQASPVSDYRPNPFLLNRGISYPGQGPSVASSSTNILWASNQNSYSSLNVAAPSDHERTLARKRRRPVMQQRVASWADPLSARDHEWKDREQDFIAKSTLSDQGDSVKRHGNERMRSLGGSVALLREEEEEEEDEDDFNQEDAERQGDEQEVLWKRRTEVFTPTRRRSFHDLESLHSMHLLPTECMVIDVELCGQMLVMSRRAEHLRNVVDCVKLLTSTLASTSTLLRTDYESHLPLISTLPTRTQVLSDLDADYARVDDISQATNTLSYESAQFNINALMHPARASRATVLSLRDKVFNTGGRRLPPGVHGAHGRFNRIQWTVGGERRLVDHRGRTESEAEEEDQVEGNEEGTEDEEESREEEDVVEHPGIRPMWLLRFFTTWVARWSATREAEAEGSAPSAKDAKSE